jgi:hypothetical protein
MLAFVVAGAALPVHAEEADSGAPGVTFASLFFPVPAGTPISVRPWDNTTQNQRVKLSLAEALHRRGVPTTDGRTSLTLNFETEVESLAVPGPGSALGQSQESRVRMNLDSVLNGRHGDGATTRYILRATLDDQQSGERLWQGEATYTGSVADEGATFSAMAPVLVDAFGVNLQPKSFRIR